MDAARTEYPPPAIKRFAADAFQDNRRRLHPPQLSGPFVDESFDAGADAKDLAADLVIGVALLGEAFTTTQAIGFGAIWAGLALYALDGWRRSGGIGPAAEAEHCATEVPPCDGGLPPKGG